MTRTVKRPDACMVRLDQDLQTRVRKYQETIQKKTPGLRCTFSDAIRALVLRGLEAR